MGAGACDPGEENQEEQFLQHIKQTSKSKNHPTAIHMYHVDPSSSALCFRYSLPRSCILDPLISYCFMYTCKQVSKQAPRSHGPCNSWLGPSHSSNSQLASLRALQYSAQTCGYPTPKLHSLHTNHPGLLTCNHPHNMHMLLCLQLLPSQRHLWGESDCLTGSPQTHGNTEQVAPHQGSMQK